MDDSSKIELSTVFISRVRIEFIDKPTYHAKRNRDGLWVFDPLFRYQGVHLLQGRPLTDPLSLFRCFASMKEPIVIKIIESMVKHLRSVCISGELLGINSYFPVLLDLEIQDRQTEDHTNS